MIVTPTKPVYVVDTNIWVGLVPFTPTLLPDLWKLLAGLADAGRLVVPEEVVRETFPTAHATRWLHDRKDIQRPTAPVWETACQIADRYPSLVKRGQPSSWADPFLIATATVEKRNSDATLWPRNYVVVTNEKRKAGRIAIPDSCDAEGIPCVDMEGWFALEGWKFGVEP